MPNTGASVYLERESRCRFGNERRLRNETTSCRVRRAGCVLLGTWCVVPALTSRRQAASTTHDAPCTTHHARRTTHDAPRTLSRIEQRARPGAGVPVEALTLMQSSGIAAPELNRCRNHP